MTKEDRVIEIIGGGRGAVRADSPVSWQEVPEQQVPALRALADMALRQIEAKSPWRPFVTRALMPEDITRYRQGVGTGNLAVPDPVVSIMGPSALPAGYWIKGDHTASPPADVTWSTVRTITPRELVTISTISNEQYKVIVGFDGIDAHGQPAIGDRLRADPIVVGVLADAVVRTENIAFATGAATTADPFQGLGQMTGFTAQASTAALIDDLMEAVYELVAAKRPPNAAFVPIRTAKKIRKLKASTGGSYLFAPNQPLAITYGPDPDDSVPIIPLDGLPNTAGSVAYVGDFAKLVVLQRLMPNARLLMAAESSYGSTFGTDQVTVRLTERLDQAVIPGHEPSFIKLTGLDAS